MKKVLVRNGRHMSPMLAVLKRHDIGEADQYGRGRWISEADIPAIREAMISEPWHMEDRGGEEIICHGTNIHNDVWLSEFKSLFA